MADDPSTGRRRTRRRRPPEDIAVLVVDRRLHEDGAARVVLGLVNSWLAARVPALLYVLQRTRPGTGADIPPAVRPVHPTARRELRLRWALVWGLLRALRLVRRADVVLAGREIGFGLVVARLATRVVRRPFAVLVQSDPVAAIEHHESGRMRPVVRWALSSADRLVCVSPGLVPTVEALGVDRARIAVAPNGVDVQALETAAAQPPPALPSGPGPLVVAIGRLTHQKGFDVLVRAHARVVAAGVPHQLVILGEGPDRAALEALARGLGVAESVHLPGFVATPSPVVAAADLYCLSSRWEGFGLGLAEAMTLGTPSIATDCVSGPRHLLHDGRFGELVAVEDVDALAAAIERHLREPARLGARAVAGRAWAKANLDVERSADAVLGVLRDLVHPGASARP